MIDTKYQSIYERFAMWGNDIIWSFSSIIGVAAVTLSAYYREYFPPGTVMDAAIKLWVVDIITGTLLSIQIGRWIDNKNKEEDFPELHRIITSGKKRRFSWSILLSCQEQLLVIVVLLWAADITQQWIVNERGWVAPGSAIALTVLRFVVIFGLFRSILRNTALITRNRMLIAIWRAMGDKVCNGVRVFGVDPTAAIEQEQDTIPTHPNPQVDPDKKSSTPTPPTEG